MIGENEKFTGNLHHHLDSEDRISELKDELATPADKQVNMENSLKINDQKIEKYFRISKQMTIAIWDNFNRIKKTHKIN